MPPENHVQREPLSRLTHIIASYIYIWWWVQRANFKARFGKYFDRGARVLLAVYLGVFLVEVALELAGHEMAMSPSLIVQAVFFVAVAIALGGKISEWRDERQDVYFATAAAEIVRLMGRTTTSTRDAAVIHDLLAIFRRNFESKGVINANLALPGKEGLRVEHVYPPNASYDGDLVLPPGKGGAGVCYQERNVVYIPNVRYRHGIIEDFSEERVFSLLPDCYQPCKSEDFSSSEFTPPCIQQLLRRVEF
jgi:hypothetical protein